MSTQATPTSEQEQRGKWDLLLLDIEVRSEQLRQMKTFPVGTYEGWKLLAAGTAAAATLLGAGAGFTALIFHMK